MARRHAGGLVHVTQLLPEILYLIKGCGKWRDGNLSQYRAEGGLGRKQRGPFPSGGR